MVTDISTLTKISEGRVVTANGSSYLRKLCQHWSHKFPVKYDDVHGKIDLAAGKCILFADADGLTVKLMMPEDGDAPRLQQVVEEHIKRFAFKETLEFVWGLGNKDPALQCNAGAVSLRSMPTSQNRDMGHPA